MSKPAKLRVLTNKVYRMAPFERSVAPTILQWYGKPENSEFFRRCPPACDWMTLDGMEKLFQTLWVVYEDGAAVGLAGLFNRDPYSRSVEVGLLIDKETVTDRDQAVRAIFHELCTYCFEYLNCHKVYIKIMPWRDKLAKRAETQGFTKECDLRDSCFFRGEYHSEMLYSCLKLEYKRTGV